MSLIKRSNNLKLKRKPNKARKRPEQAMLKNQLNDDFDWEMVF
nr:hypothetical protein [uncultured Undibacterium sp.]